jgi:hypothetical protein
VTNEDVQRITAGKTVVVDRNGTTWTVDCVKSAYDAVFLFIRCKLPSATDAKRSIGQLSVCQASDVWVVR